jgi:hypothetical protein
MNASLVDQIVHAVLYEGYILYPYRASSKKNQERFTFGRVYPEAYSVAEGGVEPFMMQTQCLLERLADETRVDVEVRFLHPMAREVGVLAGAVEDISEVTNFEVVPELRMEDEVFQTWLEAVERKVTLPQLRVSASSPCCQEFWFEFPASRSLESIKNGEGNIVGVFQRRQDALKGRVEILSEPLDDSMCKVTVRILNHTPIDNVPDKNAVLMTTFASAHTVLRVQEGRFLSMTAPLPQYQSATEACENIGTWPVLVGDEETGDCDAMLSSPIILADYPKIAAESSGDLFDGTEIDEILTLRIMTMTPEEKQEMRRVDEQARRVLERTEALCGNDLLKMHGMMRADRSFDENIFGTSKRLDSILVGDVQLQAGKLVRIRPKARADVMDMALAGKTAVIEALEQDAEGQVHLALVLQDDPGRDLGLMRQPGHRFFYGVEEIEPLKEDA